MISRLRKKKASELMKPQNKIFLVGLDLDGTLLKKDKTISGFTSDAMKTAARRGIHLVPVTGRPLSGIPKCVLELGVCRYAITTNGAAITDLKTGERVRSISIDNRKTVSIMKALDEMGVSYETFADGYGYLSPAVMEKYNKKYAFTPVGEYIKMSRKVVDDPLALFSRNGKCADEIFISCQSGEQRSQLSAQFSEESGIQFCFLDDAFLEITAVGADKGTALTYLCGLLGISRENTAAFGDNENDVSLADAAGMFVAMGNSSDQFKQRADIVADTNENDGVAKILNKF